MNRHRSPHDPEELGAHVFGLLDPAQSRAVEEHLAVCAECRREWEELRQMVDLLDDVPPEAFLDGPPDADLMLQRTLRQVRTEAGAQRRRRRLTLVGTAAVGLAVVLTGGVVIGRETAPPPVVSAAPAPSPDAVVLSGAGEEPGVAMTATITPAAGWVRLSATVQGIPPGNACFLYVVAKDGTRHVAGSWLVPQTGWRDGITLDGSAIVPPDQVAAVVVENDQGREFAVLRA